MSRPARSPPTRLPCCLTSLTFASVADRTSVVLVRRTVTATFMAMLTAMPPAAAPPEARPVHFCLPGPRSDEIIRFLRLPRSENQRWFYEHHPISSLRPIRAMRSGATPSSRPLADCGVFPRLLRKTKRESGASPGGGRVWMGAEPERARGGRLMAQPRHSRIVRRRTAVHPSQTSWLTLGDGGNGVNCPQARIEAAGTAGHHLEQAGPGTA